MKLVAHIVSVEITCQEFSLFCRRRTETEPACQAPTNTTATPPPAPYCSFGVLGLGSGFRVFADGGRDADDDNDGCAGVDAGSWQPLLTTPATITPCTPRNTSHVDSTCTCPNNAVFEHYLHP